MSINVNRLHVTASSLYERDYYGWIERNVYASVRAGSRRLTGPMSLRNWRTWGRAKKGPCVVNWLG